MGFLIDTCIWVAVERGALAPADVALFTGMEPVYISPVSKMGWYNPETGEVTPETD